MCLKFQISSSSSLGMNSQTFLNFGILALRSSPATFTTLHDLHLSSVRNRWHPYLTQRNIQNPEFCSCCCCSPLPHSAGRWSDMPCHRSPMPPASN